MSYASSALTTFAQLLGTLTHLIAKAEESGKPDLLSARLAEDMFPLATQVRIATFQVLNTLNRLAGVEHTPDEGDPATFAEAHAMVAKAGEAVAATDASAFAGPDAPVEFDLPNGMAFALTAEEYVRDWTLPQVYFHLTVFYAILRAQGLALGKADYVPYMMRHLKTPVAA